MNPRNRSFLIIGYFLALLYALPFLIMGEDSHIRVLDYLDSLHVSYKLLAESGLIFGSLDSQVNNIFNGLPRNSLNSEFDPILWLMFLFGPFNAFLVEQFLVHITAFVGMYRLLSRHFLDDTHPGISIGTALAFSFLPYLTYGMNLAAQPLALAALLSIRQKKGRWHDWLVICLFPVFAKLSLVFGFVCLIGGIELIGFFKTKKWNLTYIASLGMIGIIYCCVEYRLIYNMFLDPQFVSHRTDFDPAYLTSPFSQVFLTTTHLFKYGFYGTASFHHQIIFYSILFALVLPVLKGSPKKLKLILALFCLIISVEILLRHSQFFSQPFLIFNTHNEKIAGLSFMFALGLLAYRISFKKTDWLLCSYIILIGVAIFLGLFHWDVTIPLRKSIPIFNMFNFSRFYWLYPLLWYLVFGLSLKIILNQVKWGKPIVAGLIVLQLSYLIFKHPVFLWRSEPSYKQYYSQQLFTEVDQLIGRDKKDYRILNLGINPAVTLYNGFYNLDGYWRNYSLEYKHAFRKIIAGELEKSPENLRYFDGWGSRCKIFAHELTPYRQQAYKRFGLDFINQLEINMGQFKKLGGEYIFSAVSIKNYQELDLKLLKRFDDEESAWTVYLYKFEK